MTTNVFQLLAKIARKPSQTISIYCCIGLAIALLLASISADRISRSATTTYTSISPSIPYANGDWLTLFWFMQR